MTNTTNTTRNAEILNTIESELWSAVDSRNDEEDSRFNDEWEREDMMIGKWFNRMVECGKFDKDSSNSKAAKDAIADLWSDVLPGIIKKQSKVFYDALDDADALGVYEAILESFYRDGGADQLFNVLVSEDGEDVEIEANEDFAGFVDGFIEAYLAINNSRGTSPRIFHPGPQHPGWI